MTTILITNATLSLAALSTIVCMIAWAIRTSRPAIAPISDAASPRQEARDSRSAGAPSPGSRHRPFPPVADRRPRRPNVHDAPTVRERRTRN